MLLSALPPRRLGLPGDESPLRFRQADGPHPTTRYLYLAGEPAFELSFWCGTCPFLFERKSGANDTLSTGRETLAELEAPLARVDERVLEAVTELVPEGEYLPLLIEVRPELVAPHGERDYFTHEQVDTWGVNAFWALPENPGSFYYRTFETDVGPEEHLYEFVVPMVPPAWNERERVEHYGERMRRGVTPTAVALSTLDLCQPAMDDRSTDYYRHWGLTHFLLDGHHKLEAAARAGAPVRLLALVSLDGSLARREDVLRLPELLSRPPRRRGA